MVTLLAKMIVGYLNGFKLYYESYSTKDARFSSSAAFRLRCIFVNVVKDGKVHRVIHSWII